MSPTFITGLFLFLGLYSAWAMVNDLRTGIARGRNSSIDVRDNAGGFYLMVFVKAGFICFATAVVLHAFGLIGDPFLWMRQNLPFLVPK